MLDASLILIDGTIAQTTGLDTPAVSVDVDSNTGAKVIDLKESGWKGLAAIMTFPATASSNTYTHTLTAHVEASDEVDRNFVPVGDFPVIYSFLREAELVCTVAFDWEDIGVAIASGTGSLDSGVLLSYDSALETTTETGNIVMLMDTSDDTFDETGDTLTTNGGGAGTKALAAHVLDPQPTPGVYVCRFATDKRYVRCNLTVTATGFGYVHVFISPYPFKTV